VGKELRWDELMKERIDFDLDYMKKEYNAMQKTSFEN